MWHFCHGCTNRWEAGSAAGVDNVHDVCPECGSEFIEFTEAGAESRQQTAEQQPQPQQRERAPPPPGAMPASFSFNVMQHFGEMPSGQEHHAGAAVGAFDDLMRRHMQRMQAGAGGPSIMFGNRQGVMLQISTGGAAIPINIGMGVPLGDYAMGNNFDQILVHLAAQHEPQAHPTDQHTRDTLPKVLVPSAAAAAATARAAGPCSEEAEAESAAAAGALPSSPSATVKAGDTCAVCHDEFEEGMELSAVPGCMHCFHEACIQPWLEQHNTCPVCRHELPLDTEAQAELQRQSQQRQQEDLAQAFSGQQQGGAVPGAQAIAGFANNLLAQLNLRPGAMMQMMEFPPHARSVPVPEDSSTRRLGDMGPPRNVRARTDRRTGRGGPDEPDPSAPGAADSSAAETVVVTSAAGAVPSASASVDIPEQLSGAVARAAEAAAAAGVAGHIDSEAQPAARSGVRCPIQ